MPTLTIDLELPEAEYRFASALTEAERRRVASIGASAAFATARDGSQGKADDKAWRTAPSTPEQIQSLGVAVTQLNENKVISGDAAFEALYREKGWMIKG